MARFDLIAVYILANRKNGTLYVGVTSDLITRMGDHKDGHGSRFTAKYRTFRLVYYQRYPEMQPALQREARLKEWRRRWKIDLIEAINPHWLDLSGALSPY